MKPLKEQPENYIATINTMKGIKHTLRWKCHAPKKADKFNQGQYRYLLNCIEENCEIPIGKVLLVTTVDCDNNKLENNKLEKIINK